MGKQLVRIPGGLKAISLARQLSGVDIIDFITNEYYIGSQILYFNEKDALNIPGFESDSSIIVNSHDYLDIVRKTVCSVNKDGDKIKEVILTHGLDRDKLLYIWKCTGYKKDVCLYGTRQTQYILKFSKDDFIFNNTDNIWINKIIPDIWTDNLKRLETICTLSSDNQIINF